MNTDLTMMFQTLIVMSFWVSSMNGMIAISQRKASSKRRLVDPETLYPYPYPGDTCKDISPFCKHMVNEHTCSEIRDVREKCRKSCGICEGQVDCKRVEVSRRKACGAPEETPQACFLQGCCWDDSTKDPSVPYCYFDYFHNNNDHTLRKNNKLTSIL